jgi:hypothetical protein
MRRRERAWLRESWDQLAAMADGLDLGPRETQMLELRWVREARHYDDTQQSIANQSGG